MSRRVMVDAIKMMKAVRVHTFGGPEVMTVRNDVTVPQVLDNQVLIKTRTAGVNPVDTYIRAGNYANLPTLPYSPGKEGSGVVEEIGSNVTKFKPGDRVYNIFSVTGTYGEYYLAEEPYVFRLHESLSFHQGAAIGIAYTTAYRALVTRCGVKAGQTVLVHGASGAVGLAACQISRALGLTVIGTAGTEKGRQLIQQHGATTTFNHTQPGYIDNIRETTGGVDIVVEMLANVNLAEDCTPCKRHGKIAVIGSRGSLDFAPRLLMAKEINLFGVALVGTSQDELSEMESFLYSGQQLGWLKPVVGRVYQLEQASQAHIDVIEHSGGSHGKLMLEL